MRYLPIENIFNYLPAIIREKMSDDDLILSWAFQAYRSIHQESIQYQRNIQFIEIANHSGYIPDDYIKTHKVSVLQEPDLASVVKLFNCEDCEEEKVENRENPCPITHRYFLNSDFYQGNSWHVAKEVKVMKDDFFCKVQSQSCAPLYHIRNNSIYTSFKEGMVALDYYSFLLDEDGRFLLPEMPIVMWEYLSKHIERRYLDERALSFQGTEMGDFRMRNQVMQTRNQARMEEASLKNHWRAVGMLSNLSIDNQKAIQSNQVIHSGERLRRYLEIHYAV